MQPRERGRPPGSAPPDPRRIGRRETAPPVARPPQPVPASAWMLPDPGTADEDGVVGVGADLAPPTLVDAYRRGIFPWPHPGVPLPWFSPDPRGVIELDGVHVPRRLRTRLRGCGWTATIDRAFDDVVAACADRDPEVGTWITGDLRRAYGRLHRLGWAHSVEIWAEDRLVGGLYGVQLGGVFTGESMFHGEPDASKAALLELVARLSEAGGDLLDVQLVTPHLARMGARELRRERFLSRLHVVRDRDVRLALDARPVARLGEGGHEPPW